jgi:hypothetical protein
MLALGAAQLLGHSTLDAIATRESLLKLAIALIFFFLAAQLFSPASPRSRHRVTETQSGPWRQPEAECHPDPAGAGEGSAFVCFEQETADASPARGISITGALFSSAC